MTFDGKVVLISGGNSGIGRGIAKRFAAQGAKLALVGRDPEKGAATCAELAEQGVSCQFYSVDLAQESDVKALVASVETDFGGLDVLVNCAGVGSRRAGVEREDSPGVRWQKLRGPNLDAAYFLSAYCLPLLKRSDDAAIVNISSTATLHGNWGLYGVAKAAIEGLTRSMASEAAPYGIRVNCVSPGWIATEQDEDLSAAGTEDGAWEQPPSLLGRMGSPDEIAKAVVFFASDSASFVTGQTLIVDGGLTVLDYPSMTMLDEVGHRLLSQDPDNET